MNNKEQKDKNTVETEQTLKLINRRTLTITGVTDTDKFDEGKVLLYTCLGELLVKGKDLRVSSLSVETGDMVIEGEISSIQYGDSKVTGPMSIFGKITK
ncbi:MAG: YabP/YqfC family sporulation protein [Oscillospiraceae bacterium]|nr:YabP/YqfC family sporulation protein [Oscillospiraceae bacterium]